ncbi:MAG: BatD family protein [Dysgonamonadaceae bacterium]|jgi:hypothetical protein|nr:BatD family protein [Dysgonamonadaceae bacterium]
MRSKVLFFILLCLSTLTASAQDVTFKASATQVAIANQRFQISFTLTTTNGKQGQNFQPPASFGGLDVVFGPAKNESFSTSISGNQTVSQHSLQLIYTVMAPKEGEYTIGTASIKVDNSEYKSEPLTVKVLPPDQNTTEQKNNAEGEQPASSGKQTVANDDMIFIRAVPSKTSVYENEGFLITFKLYSHVANMSFENFNFPEYEGFISQEIEMNGNPQWIPENYNGRDYRTAILKQTILFPQRAGQITIPPGKFDIVAMVPSQRRSRSLFDDFFNTSEVMKKSLTSKPVTINVKELPEGRPVSFNGAVGDYKMTSSISRTELKANEAVTVKINITGHGNIKLLKNPEIIFPNDFEVYDPVVSTNSKASQSGVTGSRTIEYNAIPRYAGDFTIPQAQFSYFDVKSKTYKTLSTPEYTLHVKPGEGVGNSTPVISATNKENLRLLGQDIRYIKTGNVNFIRGANFFGTWRYWLWYIGPTSLFVILFIIYRKQAAENANIALVRTKKANKVAFKRLKTAAIHLKQNHPEAFYDEILKAVWGYLSDKLNIPVASLTRDNVETNLNRYGANVTLIDNFRYILDTAEFARFAPSQGSGAMDELYNKTVKAIDTMENVIKK